jgi:hypothetical protein
MLGSVSIPELVEESGPVVVGTNSGIVGGLTLGKPGSGIPGEISLSRSVD